MSTFLTLATIFLATTYTIHIILTTLANKKTSENLPKELVKGGIANVAGLLIYIGFNIMFKILDDNMSELVYLLYCIVGTIFSITYIVSGLMLGIYAHQLHYDQLKLVSLMEKINKRFLFL
jgi:UDP-N-acetylmuramyl pentapeptide phosphotransferase/UDP-N-acetylglucosamine-1-phosphate transferase